MQFHRPPRNELATMRAAVRLDAALAADGVLIRQADDITAFAAALQALSGKAAPSPPLDPAINDIDPADLLWLEARGADGATLAVQAMRRERISVPLAAHLDRQYHRYYCAHSQAELIGHAPMVHQVTGSVVYHGDLFVAEAARGKRLAQRFAVLAHLIAYLRWDPDWIWGFVAEEKVLRGYHVKIGYWRAEPYGSHYSDKPASISEKDWFVAASRADLSYRVALDQRNTE
ncbi:MAG: hypothetical protein NXI21_01980 [Alphaproteobacteria bacterium]|nr:hypothetical protein [Alphaproteobacteria bacterium]